MDRVKFETPDRLIPIDTQERLFTVLRLLSLVFLVVFIGFPLYWSISSSFRLPEELFQIPPPLVPRNPTLAPYERLFFDSNFPYYFRNSIVVGVGATVITSTLATLAGYGLARADYKGKRNLARGILMIYMFPGILLAIPLYSIFFQLNLLNSYFSLMLSHVAITLPFGIWLMWQFFQTIPMAYEESGWIAGASRLRTLWDAILPMARPGIISVAIFTFAISWNDYVFSVVIMSDRLKVTLPVGIDSFIQQTAISWDLINASGVITLIPGFLLVLFLQKYILRGFSIGRQ